MYRPLVLFTGAFVAGLLFVRYNTGLPLVILVAGLIIILGRIIFDLFYSKKQALYLSIMLLFCVPAFWFGTIKAIEVTDISETENFFLNNNNPDCNIICEYVSLNVSDGKARIKAKLLNVSCAKGSIKPEDEYIYIYGKAENYKCGLVVELMGELSFYLKARNPGEFDLKRYYLTRNIVGYITPVKSHVLSISDKITNRVKTVFNLSKDKIIKNINKYLSTEDAGVMISILTGDRSYLEEDISNLYQRAGFAHILAISGLHISILAMGLYHLLRKMKLSMSVSTSMVLAVMLVFTYFADEPVSCKRAVIMLAFSLISRIVGRRYDGLTALAVSALIILVNQPRYVYDSSFLLTFSAGLGIILMSEVKKRQEILVKNKLLKSCIMKLSYALGFQMCILPASVQFYYSFCPYSIILNFLLLPFMSILLILGMLLGVLGGVGTGLGRLISYPISFILFSFKKVCELVSDLPGKTFVTGRLNFIRFSLLLLALAVFIGLLIRSKRLLAYWLMIPYMIILSPGAYRMIVKSPPELTQLYVGQGDCAIILYNETAIAIDAGSTDKESLYNRTIEKYLYYRGYESLDYVFISHGDNDHVSGLYDYLERESLNKTVVFVPKIVDHIGLERLYQYGRKHDNIVISELELWDEIRINQLKFYVLYPSEESADVSDNESSMVLYVKYDDYNALFMGDLGKEHELRVVENLNKLGLSTRLDYLKIAHHGSKNSTGEEFLQCLLIKKAVISVGEKNFYGHPHVELLERLRNEKISILRTDIDGAVVESMLTTQDD